MSKARKKRKGRQERSMEEAEEGRRTARAQKTCLFHVEGAKLNFLLRGSGETDSVSDR